MSVKKEINKKKGKKQIRRILFNTLQVSVWTLKWDLWLGEGFFLSLSWDTRREILYKLLKCLQKPNLTLRHVLETIKRLHMLLLTIKSLLLLLTTTTTTDDDIDIVIKDNSGINSCFIIDDIINSNRLIGLYGKVFANGPGDLGSIPGQVIPNT